jgi:hypothetical protein
METYPMVTQRLAPFVLRPRLWKVALVPALIVLSLTATGCGNHRRSSLRPVFVAPAAVAPACSTPGCSTPSTVVPESMVVPGPTTSSTPPSGASSVPSVVEPSGSTLGAPAEPAPSAAPGPAPSRSSAVEEPGQLEPVQPSNNNSRSGSNSNGNGNSQTPSSSLTVPRLQPPGTSLNGGTGRGPTPTTTRLRSVSLREQLTPYTNNPDDLFAPPKADRPWKYVVLHHSATPTGSYDAIDREHRKRLGWEGCGYHFVIGNGTGSPDGQIEVAQRWTNQKLGIHCRNGKNPDVSEYGVGICLVGDLDSQAPTPRQVAAVKTLVAYLGERYNIPADHIDTHARLANSPTACPGKHFPAKAILGSNAQFVQR